MEFSLIFLKCIINTESPKFGKIEASYFCICTHGIPKNSEKSKRFNLERLKYPPKAILRVFKTEKRSRKSIIAIVRVKVKYLQGAFLGGTGHLCDQIFHAPGA